MPAPDRRPVALRGDTATVREAVRALLPETIDRASRTGWRLTFLKTDETAYSPGLGAAVRPVLSRDRWIPSQGRRRQPELRAQLGPEHVPQHLPEEWLRRHFGTSARAVPMAALQRATTVRLVQMLAGGSKEQSARYLGFPKPARHRLILTRLPATANLTPPRRADDRFDEFVLAVAGELRAGNLINYWGRRTALSDWALEEGTWQHLVATARARTDGRHLGRGPHDLLDRLAASVAIWQRATHGHYRYAPLLRTESGDWSRRKDRVTWKIMLGRGSSPIGIELHRLLNDYADALSHRIDTGWNAR